MVDSTQGLTRSQWNLLRELRGAFLNGAPKTSDYWTPETLELYDRTFAERIRWKWDAVLEKAEPLLSSLGTAESVLDWGCGTGAATERFLATFNSPSKLLLWDRSNLALQRTTEKINQAERWEGGTLNSGTWLLLSHVLSELDAKSTTQLVSLIQQAQVLLWVENGSQENSHQLSQVRNRLTEFEWILPCPHQMPCVLTQGRDWCHFFAPVPAEVFHSRFWREFSTELGIDLRSLPVSFLVGINRASSAERISWENAERILGRVKVNRAEWTLDLCGEKGVRRARIPKRAFSEPDWMALFSSRESGEREES